MVTSDGRRAIEDLTSIIGALCTSYGLSWLMLSWLSNADLTCVEVKKPEVNIFLNFHQQSFKPLKTHTAFFAIFCYPYLKNGATKGTKNLTATTNLSLVILGY
ncbi:hypothetical protein [Undibacterium sp.]|uniref:hypothetical protein n=1 Tax=Undibacterium sp. TaxID=1914977 RepID=UPI0037503D2F